MKHINQIHFENLDFQFTRSAPTTIVHSDHQHVMTRTIENLIAFHKACFIDYLPQIEADFAALMRISMSNHPFIQGLELGIRLLKTDLFVHFTYEEKYLYPYALSLVGSEQTKFSYHSNRFEIEHPKIRLDLNRLIFLMDRHLQPFHDNFAFRILYRRLIAWQSAMDIHESLEDDVLLVLVKKLEEGIR